MTRLKTLLHEGHVTERGADVLALIGIGITWGCAYFFDEWYGLWFWLLISIGVHSSTKRNALE
jgi:hypothetical protein